MVRMEARKLAHDATTVHSAAAVRGHQLAFIGANLSPQTRGVVGT